MRDKTTPEEYGINLYHRNGNTTDGIVLKHIQNYEYDNVGHTLILKSRKSRSQMHSEFGRVRRWEECVFRYAEVPDDELDEHLESCFDHYNNEIMTNNILINGYEKLIKLKEADLLDNEVDHSAWWVIFNLGKVRLHKKSWELIKKTHQNIIDLKEKNNDMAQSIQQGRELLCLE